MPCLHCLCFKQDSNEEPDTDALRGCKSGSGRRREIVRLHLVSYFTLDSRWGCLLNQCDGFIFSQDYCMECNPYYANFLCCIHHQQSKSKSYIRPQPLVIYSDRGSVYVSREYIRATKNMQCSYSKKAFSLDSACIESFHSLIKRE